MIKHFFLIFLSLFDIFIFQSIIFINPLSLTNGNGTKANPFKFFPDLRYNLESLIIKILKNSSIEIEIFLAHFVQIEPMNITDSSNSIFFQNYGSLVLMENSIVKINRFNFILNSSITPIFNFSKNSTLLLIDCNFQNNNYSKIDGNIFYGKGAKLLFNQIKFQNNFFFVNKFINFDHGFFQINNTLFKSNNFIFQENFVFLINNSTLNINNVSFKTNKLILLNFGLFFSIDHIIFVNLLNFSDNYFNNGTFLGFYNNKESEKNFLLIFKNSSIINVIFQNKSSNFFESSQINSIIIISNIKFENVVTSQYFIFIVNTINIVFLKEIFFKDCFACNIITIKCVTQVFFVKLFISKQNNPSLNYKSNFILGSCIFIIDSVNINLEEIQIIDSFSDYTTIGIKVIDESEKNKRILLNNLNIMNNTVYIIATLQVTVGLYIISNAEVYLSNSFFINNNLDSDDSILLLQGGPCIYSNSEEQHLYIYNSTFKDNRSKAYSNCIQFKGTSFNVSQSIFINNTIIFKELENKEYFNSFSMYSRKSETHTLSFGGAFSCNCNYLFINQCYFYKNEANYGGAIYINKLKSNFPLKISIFRTIFKHNEGGAMGGAIRLIVHLY